MALKVIGRTKPQLRVSTRSQAPSQAKEMAMKCDACGKLAFVKFAFGITAEERMAGVRDALEEHRKVCVVSDSTIRRTFDLWYPRA